MILWYLAARDYYSHESSIEEKVNQSISASGTCARICYHSAGIVQSHFPDRNDMDNLDPKGEWEMLITEHEPCSCWLLTFPLQTLWGLCLHTALLSLCHHISCSLLAFGKTWTESQIVWAGRNPRDHPAPAPLPWTGHLPLRASPFSLAVTTCVFSTLLVWKEMWLPPSGLSLAAPLRSKQQFHTLILYLPFLKPLLPQSTGGFCS